MALWESAGAASSAIRQASSPLAEQPGPCGDRHGRRAPAVPACCRRDGLPRSSQGLGPVQPRPVSPAWLAILAAVLLLDLTIYGQHVAFHAVPLLWRLHRMHHADLEFDVTTGLRFHPARLSSPWSIKLAAVLVLGAPPLAVLVFEVAAQRHIHVQPRQRPVAALARSCAPPRRRHAGDASRSSFDQTGGRRIAISASTCPGGIACSALIARSRHWVMRA